MDVSKVSGKLEVGVLCRELSIEFNFRLPEHYIDFQAKVAANKVTVNKLLRGTASFKNVYTYADDWAAILALGSLTMSLRLIK